MAWPPISPLFGFSEPPITPCTGIEFPFKDAIGAWGAGADPIQRFVDSLSDPEPVGKLIPSIDARAELPEPGIPPPMVPPPMTPPPIASLLFGPGAKF